MNYTIIAPCEELKDFVNRFWFAKWDEPTQYIQSTFFRPAKSLVEVVFIFEGGKRYPELFYSSIQGPTAHHAQYPATGFFELFGVSLYAYAIPYFFNIPTSVINNEYFLLETLLGNEGKLLSERIEAAILPNERIKILTDYFKSRLGSSQFKDELIIKAIKQIRNHHGNVNIEHLSQSFCYSHKQFNRRFKEHTGFNPKLFARIVRFENAINNYKNHGNLAELAYRYGYYDQAHFIRDFRSLAGYSPNKFFKLNGY